MRINENPNDYIGNIYIIGYSNGSDVGYIGYDNKPCNSLDFAMKFSTRLEAENNLNALRSEWKSELSIIEVPIKIQ